MLFWRWESEYRWYEAELMSDLFGDWLIVPAGTSVGRVGLELGLAGPRASRDQA